MLHRLSWRARFECGANRGDTSVRWLCRAFARSFLRLLGSDGPSCEPGVEVPWIEGNTQLAFDDLGQSRSGPQFVGETERFGILP